MDHEQAWLLIPWLVNGRLNGETQAAVEAHADRCAECRRERATQARLHAAMHGDDTVAFAAEPALQKLLARIDAGAAIVSPDLAARRAGGGARSDAVRWLAAAVVVEALALGLLGARAWRSETHTLAPLYTTLTTPTPAPSGRPAVRIVFAPALELGQLETLLHSVDARILDGPTAAGVYTLGFAQGLNSAAEIERRVVILRANGAVRLAEPVATSRALAPP